MISVIPKIFWFYMIETSDMVINCSIANWTNFEIFLFRNRNSGTPPPFCILKQKSIQMYFVISPPLWLRGDVSTKPLARPNPRSSFSQPARLRACLARQTLVLEVFCIRTWLRLGAHYSPCADTHDQHGYGRGFIHDKCKSLRQIKPARTQ